jgi:hypothetical protein
MKKAIITGLLCSVLVGGMGLPARADLPIPVQLPPIPAPVPPVPPVPSGLPTYDAAAAIQRLQQHIDDLTNQINQYIAAYNQVILKAEELHTLANLPQYVAQDVRGYAQEIRSTANSAIDIAQQLANTLQDPRLGKAPLLYRPADYLAWGKQIATLTSNELSTVQAALQELPSAQHSSASLEQALVAARTPMQVLQLEAASLHDLGQGIVHLNEMTAANNEIEATYLQQQLSSHLEDQALEQERMNFLFGVSPSPSPGP